MQLIKILRVYAVYLFILFLLCGCSKNTIPYLPINGFSDLANRQLNEFLLNTLAEPGRKIAVFDGDGTVLGQTPHYLADECMYLYAKTHPEQKPEIIQKMIKQSNVSIPYVQNRVLYMSGMPLQFYRELGHTCFKKYYSDKIFEPMRDLINVLKENNFEIWIVTASPEGMYQQFLSEEFSIPITHIIGVKAIIRNGIITDEIVRPIPQNHGKKESIETFIQDIPLLVAGNSRGDKEMIEFSRGLRMIVNPDEHIAVDQEESIAEYAEKNDWLIVYVDDVPESGFPAVSSKEFNIRINKTRRRPSH